jgi:hypothetical protein
MALRDAVARQRAIEDVLWTQIGEGGSQQALTEVQAAWKAFNGAKPAGEAQARARLAEAINGRGAMRDALRKMEEASQQIDRRARLVKTASEVDVEGMLAEQFVLELGLLQRALAAIIDRYVPDPKDRQRFLSDAQRALEAMVHRDGSG